MREMLVRWFKTAIDPRPTWEAVVAALRSPSVDAQHQPYRQRTTSANFNLATPTRFESANGRLK